MEKKGGFAGCPLRREAGMFAGRANPEMEVTPTSKHRRRFQNLGRRSPGGEGGEMAGGDLHSRQFGRGEGRETLQNLLHRWGGEIGGG